MGFKDFMSGGNTYNEELVDNVYDWQETIHKSEARILEESGAMSSEEVTAYLNENLAANEEARDEHMSQVKGQTTKNIVSNSLCLGLSFLNGISAVKGLSAAKTAVQAGSSGVGAAFSAGYSAADDVAMNVWNAVDDKIANISNATLRNVADKINTGVYQVGSKTFGVINGVTHGAGGLLRTSGNLLSTGIKTGNGLKIAGGVITGLGGVAPTVLPAAASFYITHNRSKKTTEELTQTINTLTNTANYLESQRVNMNEDMHDDVGHRTFMEWSEAYTSGMNDLLLKQQNGEITEEQYCQMYEEYNQIRNEELQLIMEKYPEYAKQIINEGAAYDMSNYVIDHNIDPNDVTQHSTYADNQFVENPEAYDNAVEHYENYQQYDTGSDFGNFISNLHATILHYAPVVAYAEALVAKSIDSVLEFADDYIPGYEHAERYTGQGLAEVANAISEKADAQYEVAMEQKQLQADNDAHVYDGVQDYVDAQQEQSATDPAMTC